MLYYSPRFPHHWFPEFFSPPLAFFSQVIFCIVNRTNPDTKPIFFNAKPTLMRSFNLLIALLFCLHYVPLAQAQAVEDDFEGNGNINTWYGDACDINTSFSNPYQQGINTSATVLEYQDNGGQYANVRFDVSQNFNLAGNAVFSLKIYIPSAGLSGNQPNQVSLKLQDGTLGSPWVTQSEIIKPLVLDAWQTVSFDFVNDNYINLDPGSLPPVQRTDFNRIVIQLNGENNYDHVLAYLDDFFHDNTPPTDPVYNVLIWSDEFETDGVIDSIKWFHQTQLPPGGSWYNGEIQHYTDRIDNSFVSDGTLKILAKKETFTDQGQTKQYTSARLNSKFAFKYGKIEMRAKLLSGVGTWPAFWTLGKNIDEDGAYWDNEGFGTSAWPYCGEIDIMEHWGTNQNYVQSATHTPSSYGGTVNLGGQVIPTASTDFHVYALVWSPEKLVFSVDGVIHYTYEPAVKDENTWPFDAEQYVLLNVAIQPVIDPNFIEGAMEIDYVRIYQDCATSTNEKNDERTLRYYPNPVDDDLTIQLNEMIKQDVNVKIYSLDGQLMKSYNQPVDCDQFTLYDLGFLPNGMYIFSLRYSHRNFNIKVYKN